LDRSDLETFKLQVRTRRITKPPRNNTKRKKKDKRKHKHPAQASTKAIFLDRKLNNQIPPKMASSSHPSSFSNPDPDPDPFTSLLTLEDTLYTSAYTSGTTAGTLAGRIEGRIFGLESGFDKFRTLGALHGRSVVWGARLLCDAATPTQTHGSIEVQKEDEATERMQLPRLNTSARLTNHATLLHALTDPLTFSTDNTEDSVADFDDRVRRAGAKAKVIERIVGEGEGIERKGGEGKEKKLDGASMEDFVAGGRVLR
jgi:hypothetical protein